MSHFGYLKMSLSSLNHVDIIIAFLVTLALMYSSVVDWAQSTN